MGVIATLERPVVEVAPGESADCEVRLYNDGTVVDTFVLDVLGDARDWVTVSPQEVSAFPGDVATAKLTFAPPRSADVAEGVIGYALRAMSQEDTEHSAIEEGSVRVGGFQEVETELVPRTIRGSRAARGRIAIDNLGNSPVPVRLSGTDEDGLLRFRFKPSTVTVDGGTTRMVPYRLRPKTRFLRGQPRTHVYRVVVTAAGKRTETTGSLVQPPMLPHWAPKALLLAAAAAVVTLVISPTFFKPQADSQVTSAQSSQTPSPGTSPGSGASDGATQPPSGDQGATTSPSNGTGGSPGTTPSPSGSGAPSQGTTKPATGTSPSTSPGNGTGSGTNQGTSGDQPVETHQADLRLGGKAKPAKAGVYTRFDHTVPDGNVLEISDLVLENPANDSGTLQLLRGDQLLRSFDLKDPQREWHWLNPRRFAAGEKLVIAINCTNTGGKECTTVAALSGHSYGPGQQ
ncbi:hypothetical protein ACIRS1_05335 [Kitasatospora sp. NPDC101176]|uniref:COG1470 family protein n=1 Tax=Kitasatospora sp. NPDC101176 TaxID=3364099 RepID=UPI003827D4B1